jgi:hypothetical protein
MIKTIALELSRIFLKFAMDQALRKALPKIFKRLDLELPSLLAQKASPVQVQCTVTDAIENVTGRITTPTQIGVVMGLYDPIEAALSNLKR